MTLVLPARGKDAKPVDERGVPGHLRCSSCQQAVFNSFQSPHGCRLCQTCVEALPVHDKVPCPGRTEACKDKDEDTTISQAQCFPDIASRREIGRLSVFCPNKADGCGAQFPWRDVESHLSSCDFERVPCDLCGDKVVKRELLEHRKSECRQRRELCSDCGVQVVVQMMAAEHKNLQSASCCPHFQDVCPHCGEGGSLGRPDYLLHLPACRQKPTPCHFAHLGCKVVDAASRLEKHYKEAADAHLEMMDARLKSRAVPAAGTPVGASAAAAATTESAAAAASAPDGAQRDVAEIERKLMNIFAKFKNLQPNAAAWASTTVELEELIRTFGGVNGFKSVLKVMDDKLRQIEATERAQGPSGATTATEASRLLDRMKTIELRFDALELTSFEGCLTWKVSGFAARRREARSGSLASLFSPPFFSKRYGYMFRVRLYLNGTDGSEGAYVSAQLVLTQSEYDDVLDWPLVADVTLRLLHPKNRNEDVISKATLDAQRPNGLDDLTMHVLVSRFAKINQVEEKFVKNDCIYVEAEVEPRPTDANRRGRRR